MVVALVSGDDVRKQINKKLSKLCYRDECGIQPFICIICDEFVAPSHVERLTRETLEKQGHLLVPEIWNDQSEAVLQCYKYAGETGNDSQSECGQYELQSMMLSPRACLIVAPNRHGKDGFSCCQSCYKSLTNGKMPKFAIANNYSFGSPPACLLNLTDIELAMLTPVKTYGYIFSYTGGKQKQLKGSLAYYKVDIKSIARSAMHLDVLGLNRNIVVLLHGHMTLAQHTKAREKSKIRTEYVLNAVEWLCKNNEEWIKRNIDLNSIRQQLVNPTVLDNSITVDGCSTSSNIETSESFQVFFPDGSMSSATGGQESLGQFNEMLHAALEKGYDIGFKNNLMKEAVADFRDNNLVNACLLQFPFGRGGMHEQRIAELGNFTSFTDIEEYIQHLSRISMPHFHHELFSLVLYNLSMKQAMLRNAGWKVRRKCDAKEIAEELTMEDVTQAINMSQSGGRKRKESGSANKLLTAIDAMAKAVPHTNEAAKAARASGECLQHHFGAPSVFLTVTPDDDNSFFVEVFANELVDDETQVSKLSDDELIRRARKRTELRIKYPGICALHFEYVLEIIIEEVIGWNIAKNQARTDKAGLFGIPEAYTVTVEEQGRRTLHTHIQVWIKEVNKVREALHCGIRADERKAKKFLQEFVDSISSCSVTGRDKESQSISYIFNHKCSVKKRSNRSNPIVVEDQTLRDMRQKEDKSAESSPAVVRCPHCGKEWSSDEIVSMHLKRGAKVEGLTEFPDGEVRRLKAMAVEYQKTEGGESEELQCTIINAAYNHHSHTKSCFEIHRHSKDGKNKGEAEKVTECRYRYPQGPQPKTKIQNVSDSKVAWYNWDGSKTERHIKEVCPKRSPYDVFQNVSCPPISTSLLTCNTNVTVVQNGPVAAYSFKYVMKGTQKEDTKEYGGVKDAMQKVLSKIRTHQSDRSESVKRLLAASFAHQKTNVVGAAMASYLTRTKSRFQFSHKIVWCPLKDIESLVEGGSANVVISQSNNVPFFQSSALHYLCRPHVLEKLSPFEFYSTYEVVGMTRRNRNSLLQFSSDHPFKHPSYQPRSDKFLQGVRKRATPHLVKVFQYAFADTADLGGSIIEEDGPKTIEMEEYCKLVMLLFLPYRQLSDICENGSFTSRLRSAWRNGEISTTATQFLQNLQDARSNNFRVSRIQDDLQRRTELKAADGHTGQNDEEMLSNDIDDEEAHRGNIDQLLQFLEMEENEADMHSNQEGGWITPDCINFSALRSKGSERCGYSGLASMQEVTSTNSCSPILEVEEEVTIDESTIRQAPGGVATTTEEPIPSQHDIVRVLLNRTRRRRRTFREIAKNDKEVSVLEANGSVNSIIDWGRKAKLDSGQRRAFEIFASTYVLSFYRAIDDSNELVRSDRHHFAEENRKLEKLSDMRRRNQKQLICLLHGPGGSGKTTVIDLLTTYAEEFSNYLENFEYSPRSIVVTAMTGAAATLLLGETAHSAMFLNFDKVLPEQIEAWSQTRLLIIDEISFASNEDFKLMHNKLKCLKQRLDEHYGGIDIIFSGDMRQLEPVGAWKNPVYNDDCAEFKDWVNCYIELNGMHRFKDDMEWGRLLRRFRNGRATVDDIKRINERVVTASTVLPNDIKYATYFNRDRDAINTALFEERCKKLHRTMGEVPDSVLIFSSNIFVKDGSNKYVRLRNCRRFWENCGEDSVKLGQGRGRIDPVLKLYKNCRVMLTKNTSVKQGQANGSQATLEKVVLKQGEQPTVVLVGGNIPVAAVQACQVSHLVLKHSNSRIEPSTFKLFPVNHSMTASMLKPHALQAKGNETEKLLVKAKQVPVVLNNASTGHKLQGTSVDTLFVHNWSYVTNWVYVMLSRVRTHKGLYCRKPVSADLRKFEVPKALTRMLRKFAERSPQYWTEDEYDEIFDL